MAVKCCLTVLFWSYKDTNLVLYLRKVRFSRKINVGNVKSPCVHTNAPSESVIMSLTEEQRARMERMKKVAQEKKKWKDKATHSGGGNNSGAASGGQALSAGGGCGVAVQSSGGQGVPIAKSGQGGGFQKVPVVVDRVCQQGGSSKTQQSSSTVSSAPNITSGGRVAGMISSNGSSSSNHQSSTAARPAPTFCGGSQTTNPVSSFYRPQAAPPPLPRGIFRPQEQPSAFKHQAPSKVSHILQSCTSYYFLNFNILYIFSGDHSSVLAYLKKQV